MDGVPQTLFAKVAFAMATSDAERIAVNAAASSVPSGGGNDSALTQHYTSLHSALAMLAERTQIILEYCRDMEAGNVPVNHEVCADHCGFENTGNVPVSLSCDSVHQSPKGVQMTCRFVVVAIHSMQQCPRCCPLV